MLAALLATLLSFQQPEPAKPKPEPAVAEASAPGKPASAWTDREAKVAVDAFAKAMKGSPSLADKNRALDALGQGSHKLLVKPIGAVIENDKSVLVRKRAIELLAQQPPAEVRVEIVRLLKSPNTQAAPPVLAALVTTLAARGYQPGDWPTLGKLFGVEYTAERVALQEAILDLAAQFKEKQAVAVLLDNLDEPVPHDVDGAENPPASYWEGRWKAWKVWRGRVKETLFTLTGQRFSTAAEARAWLGKNPLK